MLEKYCFLGKFVGSAIRCRMELNLNIPLLFWKGFVGDPITLMDGQEVDKDFFLSLQAIQNIKSYEELEAILGDMTYAIRLSSGELVALNENETDKMITWENRFE